MTSQISEKENATETASAGKPLKGRTVVITRSTDQGRELTERLENLGARVLSVPAVSFSEPDDWAPVDRAVGTLAEFDWVLFTSANAARFFGGRCRKMGVNPGTTRKPRYAAVGAATGGSAAAEGFMISYTARGFQAAALARELAPSLGDKRVLLPRSDHAAPDLPEALAHAGALVTEVIAYKTGGMSGVQPELLDAIRQRAFDAITFFSPSAVESYRAQFGADMLPQFAKTRVVAAIGPVTAATLRRYNCLPAVEARQATADSMATAIADYFERQPKRPPNNLERT